MSAVPRTPSGLHAPGCPGAAERIYRLLLRAYPPDFRAKYGWEMALLFRDQCREGEVRTLGFWAAVIWDVARSAPGLRAEAWRAGADESTRTLEVIVRVIAMLTVLLGAYVAVNAFAEGVPGLRGTMSGRYMLAVVLVGFAGALLLTAGGLLLRRTPSGQKAASLALLASLAMIVAARLLFPWMSLFSQFVGIGLPVALLIALHWPGRPSASRAAS
jgi:hypothetical protein